MNTYQIQVNDKQLADLESLLEHGSDDLTASISVIDRGDYEDGELEEIERRAGEGYESLCEAIQNRDALWSTSCGRVELDVPMKVVETIAVSGDNEPAVVEALKEPSYLRKQLERMDMEVAAESLAESGLEQFGEGGEHRKDVTRIMRYTLWMACQDIQEEAHTAD